ncbi:carbamoyl-phosphate synthase, large subunit [Neorickettsia helminthoeca str. Oregon]|uniref:Carbamoyl phosphate synthase large chain n=1 Tax=Neorickettsia helminthoeca str. Oregon TaxID=1286528 RepID=X5HJC2_9RICK|nr:carbamoyl-phosphate synthase large subunit [Neorickettsia helminthoeca]AHX11169.1 carbamoyl-phosphate synthase, large subunit [Neorickettsia helminthoeca str. Oregon]
MHQKKYTIMVIGAGPIIIGQACEFDYSGTQACRVLKKHGHRVVLINPNPATIMTDPETADVVYIEPITSKMIESIIILEKPDKLLPTVGGQTALNAAMELVAKGILAKYGVQLIGASKEVIENAEKRSLFNSIMREIGLQVPKNMVVTHVNEIEQALEFIGIPAIIRPSFTLGGLGGGVATTRFEFFKIINEGLKFSPVSEVQVDESVLGWQEFELEVVRDSAGNAIVVCPIENTDPMGVHTGDSVTVSPIFTLRDEEYQLMRDAAFKVLNRIGVNTGGANVQFAVNPENGEIRVIEMNPRVSRSSALASKATGYPIAKVAAQLATGLTLPEICNDAVPKIPASFEPVMDYVVVKIPRFNFDKFLCAKHQLSSSMKSVGTTMAIGRCFQEALQKAFCSLEQGFDGLNRILEGTISREEVSWKLSSLIPNKILIIADAMRMGFSIEEIAKLSKYNEWFLLQIQVLVELENEIKTANLSPIVVLKWKKRGFSDSRIATLRGCNESEIRKIRKEMSVLPVFKKVDTCAAEFESDIMYLYSTYEGDTFTRAECESSPSDRKKVIVLGSGPNRIGQGIEFDYTCVHAIAAIKEMGYEAIMLNCNPETVSTDYDISDKLYFTPITVEAVLDILEKESERGELLGVILQCGGQTPLKLAKAIEASDTRIIGTSFTAIDTAEDRESFNQLIAKLDMSQPNNTIAFSREDVARGVDEIGFPMIVRPSYVLGGESMQIIYDTEMLADYLGKHNQIFNGSSLLLDRFLLDAIELDVDAISDGEDVYVAGIMEHIEEAGVHSGDSAFVFPPQKLSSQLLRKIKDYTRRIALTLNVIGFLNIQFAIEEDEIYVLEVNPRSSRTIPFVAKALGIPLAKIATKVMLGKKLKDFRLEDYECYLKHVFVKQPVFSFEKFPESDVLLGPEMKSTGEVMGIGEDFNTAFAKVCIASMKKLPVSGNVFFSIRDEDKLKSVEIAKILSELRFTIFATKGSAAFLKDHNIDAIAVNKVKEGSPHVVDMIMNSEICLVINTCSHVIESVRDSMSIRSSSIINQIPCCTNIHSALALVRGIKKIAEGNLPVYPLHQR